MDINKIDKKWQNFWSKENSAVKNKDKKKKFYCLEISLWKDTYGPCQELYNR